MGILNGRNFFVYEYAWDIGSWISHVPDTSHSPEGHVEMTLTIVMMTISVFKSSVTRSLRLACVE